MIVYHFLQPILTPQVPSEEGRRIGQEPSWVGRVGEECTRVDEKGFTSGEEGSGMFWIQKKRTTVRECMSECIFP
jgi:hypothetical protein